MKPYHQKLRIGAIFLVILSVVTGNPNTVSAADILPERYILEDKDAHWQITANKMSAQKGEGLFVAQGDVVIARNGQTLSSKMAVYNEKTGIVEVTGDVRLQTNGDFLTGDRGIFDLKNHNGQITKGHLFLRENNFHIYGDVMEKTGPNTYSVKSCRLTTCDGEKPAWSISASDIEVTVEGYGKVKHATFRIRDFPVFYLPYAVFPAKTKRQTGLLLPKVGYSNINGFLLEVPFFWAISEQIDATFYQRYMDKRGYMQGLEFRYLQEDSSHGIFLGDVLSDRKEEKNLNDPDDAELSPFPRTNKTRYWIRGRADQELPLRINARLDTDFVSDQDFIREFVGGGFGFGARPAIRESFRRPVDEIQSPTRRSALRLARDGEQYSLQALASYNQRPENPPNDMTPQPLGLRFSVLPKPIRSLPLFFTFDTDYNYIWRDVGQKGHSLSFNPIISYPMWFGHYLEFETAVGYNWGTQWLDNNPDNISKQSRDVYHLQARLSSLLERVFAFEWRDVKKLKHRFTPVLTYDYRGHKDEDLAQPWFEPLDATGDINRISLSLENFLDARKEAGQGDVTYAQLGIFNLIQGYDIEDSRRRDGEEKPWEPLIALMSVMLLPNLDFDGEARWDYYEDAIAFTDLSLALSVNRSGGRNDTYTVDYQYSKSENSSLNYYLNVNITHGFSVGTSLKRDLELKHNVEQGYWLDYRSQCWGVRVQTGKLDEISSIMITFNLVGLGNIGTN
ncbi:LPS-assembly protein LptD [Thermodesulfobacteriota bacterium]